MSNCSAPIVQLIQSPVIFSLDTVLVKKPFPFTASLNCTGPTNATLSCQFTSNSTDLSVNSNSEIEFPPTASLGLYNGTATCSHGSASSILNFPFYIVYGQNMASSSSVIKRSIPDCVDTTISQSSMDITVDGSILPFMITITPSVSTNGDAFKLNGVSRNFTQKNVNDGLVTVSPALLTDVYSTRDASIPYVAQDPSASYFQSNALFSVVYTYCPTVTPPATLLLTSDSSTPVVVPTSLTGLSEKHSLSVWDVEWKIQSNPGAGRWEWYCPDPNCGGPGWKILIPPAIIKQSWVVMNAIRWNPAGAITGITYTNTWETVNSYVNGLKLTTTLSLKVDSSVTVSNPPTPYESSPDCRIMTLGYYSAQKSGDLPYGPYVSQSPIRPICFSTAASPSGIKIHDIFIRPTVASNITISGAVKFGSDLVLPKGFVPINFTASTSTAGQLYQALHITSSPSSYSNPIFISLPQTTLESNLLVKKLTLISVLRYEALSGQFSHVSPSSWNQDSATDPLVMSVTLPKDGYYVFGYIDVAAGFTVPVSSNTYVSYLKEYGPMNVQVDRGNFKLEFIASKSTRFTILKPKQVQWSPDGLRVVEKYYITGDYDGDASYGASMNLVYNYEGKSTIYWGHEEVNRNKTIGTFYNMTQNYTKQYSNTSSGYKLYLNTSATGFWSVLEVDGFVSASSFSLSNWNPSHSLIVLSIALSLNSIGF